MQCNFRFGALCPQIETDLKSTLVDAICTMEIEFDT